MVELSQGRPVAPDLLLLAVGERSHSLTRGPLGVVFAAGAEVDEVLAGRPIAELGPDRSGLAAHLTTSGPDRLAEVTQALVAARAVEPSRTKVLGLCPRDGLRVVEPTAAARAQGRLRDALVPGRPPASADATLAALASVDGLARVHALSAAGRTTTPGARTWPTCPRPSGRTSPRWSWRCGSPWVGWGRATTAVSCWSRTPTTTATATRADRARAAPARAGTAATAGVAAGTDPPRSRP